MVSNQLFKKYDEFENRIRVKRNKLINRLGKIKVNQRKALTEVLGERVTEKEQDEFADGIVEAIRKELKQTDRAMWRIKNNIYGVCSVCKKNISLERLDSYPYTDKCTKCALLQTLQTINSS